MAGFFFEREISAGASLGPDRPPLCFQPPMETENSIESRAVYLQVFYRKATTYTGLREPIDRARNVPVKYSSHNAKWLDYREGAFASHVSV
jgi:hypothetical protein